MLLCMALSFAVLLGELMYESHMGELTVWIVFPGHAKERPSATERVRGIFLRVREHFLRVRALFKWILVILAHLRGG